MKESTLSHWDEKELEIAGVILSHALGWVDRSLTFDPVSFSLENARKLIKAFKNKHMIDE